MKGDIPGAIDLANQALTKQREGDDGKGEGNDPHVLADAALFLGKLLQLNQRYEEAEALFREAHSSLQLRSPSPRDRSPGDEHTALSHLAHAQRKLRRFDDAEDSYVRALRGLEGAVGWEAGITNHTGIGLARLYRERGRDADAAAVLNEMRAALANVFGDEDPRAVQIDIELADAHISMGDRREAILLLDQVVECLPPGSPESRRAFMRLEELKEEEEAEEPCDGSDSRTITKVTAK